MSEHGVVGAMASSLISKNITIEGHRTSIRLEPDMWEALDEVCRREGISIHTFCSIVDQRRTASSLTAAVRVELLNYYREASKGRSVSLMPSRLPAQAQA